VNVLDLFSGIGGFSLGLERAGMRTVAFCEIEPYCRAVLAKHWPGVPIIHDVRAVGAQSLAGVEAIDVICGGFPCQDISNAGKRAGIDGARSGLWSEYARIIGELRPRYVIVENVAALLGRGLERVLGDLATLGFDAEWHCIPAAAVGAPHIRDRLWCIAYAQHPDAHGLGLHRAREHEQRDAQSAHEQIRISRSLGEILADAGFDGRKPRRAGDGAEGARGRELGRGSVGADEVANTNEPGLEIRLEGQPGERAAPFGRGWWVTEPDVGRVAHGVPARVDRLRALGNAVVPQVVEIIGRAIMKQMTNDQPFYERK
jgi:DNA (cytosine-5)-methyltransferase 1